MIERGTFPESLDELVADCQVAEDRVE
ncbi:MAG: hypothetical protein RMY28_003325 [Nostoc sp. ChiSLP01]|nr:hypothetical protein [Nostoc sp. CmiSLP01]MDZ8283284.1 hypothetical protein [Nostoc sp. ChiSLP01]